MGLELMNKLIELAISNTQVNKLFCSLFPFSSNFKNRKKKFQSLDTRPSITKLTHHLIHATPPPCEYNPPSQRLDSLRLQKDHTDPQRSHNTRKTKTIAKITWMNTDFCVTLGCFPSSLPSCIHDLYFRPIITRCLSTNLVLKVKMRKLSLNHLERLPRVLISW